MRSGGCAAAEPVHPPARVVGIVGGGQLARLAVPAAIKLGIELRVLDPNPDGPAARAGLHVVAGRFDDAAALRRLVEQCDVTTFETESVDVDVLVELAAAGHTIVPHPRLMRQLTNKLDQKRLLRSLGLPIPDFAELTSPTLNAVREFGLPAVLKRQRGGYDGRGVRVVHDEHSSRELWHQPSLVEEYLPDVIELAVLVARTADGETRAYPVAEMVFAADHALDYLVVPATQPAHTVRAAEALAIRTVSAIGGVGLFAVELFLTRDGRLLINEIAPRAHNSGHYTLEACMTSQFEQHLRAVTGQPLGSVELLRPAAMINLVGSPGYRGATVVEGVDEAVRHANVAVHLYDKSECWPGRKMGHITALGDSAEAALQTARAAASRIRVRGSARL